jgi:Ca2+-transporting ATPase
LLHFFLKPFASVSSAVPHSHPDGALGFGIKEDQLTVLTRDHNYSALQQYGGVV